MNIITWAESAEEAQQKDRDLLRALSADFVRESDEFHDRIDRAGNNPEAILCGTFHRYKAN
jgi:hypothetical protein